MKVINQRNQVITEYDLELGKLVNGTFKHKDGTVEKVQIYVLNKEKPNRVIGNKIKIQKLKKELSNTDYKIIKCIESYLIGEVLPYDINQLHTERQAIRDQINKLEKEVQ